MMRLLSAGCLIVLLAGCDLVDDGEAVPRERETALPMTQVARAVQGQLRQMDLRLNNYGRRGEEQADSWHRADDAVLAVGGREVVFTLPEAVQPLGPFRLLYYVQDVRAAPDRITVAPDTAAGAELVAVILPFEQEGAEFKGRCLSETVFGTRSCLGSTDAVAPDLEWDAPALRIVLRPVVYEAGLSLEAVRVDASGAVQAGGVCALRLGGYDLDVCDRVSGYRDEIRSVIEEQVLTELRRDDVQALIAAETRPLLDALGIGQVVGLRVAGGELVVQHRPAA